MTKSKKYLLWIFAAFFVGMLFPRAYSTVDQTYQQLRVLVEVLELVKDNYVEEVDTQKLVYGAADGVVRQLDDFSQFMDPDTNKLVKNDTDGDFGGLGITVGNQDGYLIVVSPMPGTPAYKAGILPQDRIIKIDGESTKDMSYYDAIKRMRGKAGTKITLTIARETPEKKDDPWTLKDITMERAKIVETVVRYHMLENKIGYIHVSSFSGHVMDEMNEAMADLKKQGMEALVIDLRYNPGGLLEAAVDMSKLFLSGGKMIVSTNGRHPENHQEFHSDVSAQYSDLPLVVLVNDGSASASEIVAGAMQDNHRGAIIGERSFGKGSVQEIRPLSDGSGLRLTVAHYYTPSGKCIQRDPKTHIGGIVPDVDVKISTDTDFRVKLMNQIEAEQIYAPGKEPVPSIKKKDQVRDEVLDKAIEILKARSVITGPSKS
jgi:carboxyl-terminal processing protease